MRHLVWLLWFLLMACSSKPEALFQEITIEDIKQQIPSQHTKAFPQQAEIAAMQCQFEKKSDLLISVQPVELSFVESDLRDALTELSLMTNISIVMDDSVEGLVSASFTDAKLPQILNTLLATGNFGYKIHADFIFVGSMSPADPSFHLLSDVCIYSPQHQEAKIIAALLPAYYQQFLNLNNINYTFSIVAPNSVLKKITEMIALVDKPKRQVLLELSIVEVSRNTLKTFGINWQNAVQVFSEYQIIQAITEANKNQSGISIFNSSKTSIDSVSRGKIQNMINFLQSHGGATVKAIPSIVVMSGQEANFKSMQTVWYNPNQSSGNNKWGEIHYGVQLNVIPYIFPNNDIRLEIIKSSVSDLLESLTSAPKLIEHSISSTVRVKNGGTLIIAGLLQKKKIKHISSVPGLSKIPLIGKTFSNSEDTEIEMEVIIIIRPRII